MDEETRMTLDKWVKIYLDSEMERVGLKKKRVKKMNEEFRDAMSIVLGNFLKKEAKKLEEEEEE